MSQIEKEIKILNINVENIKNILRKKGIKPKWQYIQDIYTFDLPSTEELYINAINSLKTKNDIRLLEKFINDIKPCFNNEDLISIKNVIGFDDILEYANNTNDYTLLEDNRLVDIIKNVNKNYSKWVRMRKTGDETTITIKKIISNKGIYEINNVSELEFNIPNIEFGKEFLSDLGYFFDRHQTKMRIAYDYNNTEIVIDKWPYLEPYIEIEGNSEKEIMSVVSDLGFSTKDALVINTDDIYMEKGINVYTKQYNDLSFSEKELKEINNYMNLN